jgi:hypothetical protein
MAEPALQRPTESTDLGGGVTLQISVAPGDFPHARATLRHQLRRWGGQVDEVMLTLDRSGDGERDRAHHRDLGKLLSTLLDEHLNARVVEVGYDASTMDAVRRRFSLTRPVPTKDCFGKAVYAYLFGLWAVSSRYVLHVDSDMMFGGGSQGWIAEAKRVLAQPHVFTCSPLPGPPSPGPWRRRVAIGHAGSRRPSALSRNGVPLSLPGLPGPAYRFSRMSTRNFMLDRSSIDGEDGGLPMARPGLRALIGAVSKGALVKGNPLCAPAETSLTQTMTRLGQVRVDFLGTPPGMWSLHPPVRSIDFYRTLPEIIRRIEADDIPERQRGDYDLCAWTDSADGPATDAPHADR